MNDLDNNPNFIKISENAYMSIPKGFRSVAPPVFNVKWDTSESIPEPEFVICVDTYDEGNNAYCLMRAIGDKKEVILAKKGLDSKDCEAEVQNLSKYFNATIVKEK